MSQLLQVELNGSRSKSEHPKIPRSLKELAKEARSSVDAGPQIVHFHPYDPSGIEILSAEPCAAAIKAVRAACPSHGQPEWGGDS